MDEIEESVQLAVNTKTNYNKAEISSVFGLANVEGVFYAWGMLHGYAGHGYIWVGDDGFSKGAVNVLCMTTSDISMLVRWGHEFDLSLLDIPQDSLREVRDVAKRTCVSLVEYSRQGKESSCLWNYQ